MLKYLNFYLSIFLNIKLEHLNLNVKKFISFIVIFSVRS